MSVPKACLYVDFQEFRREIKNLKKNKRRRAVERVWWERLNLKFDSHLKYYIELP
jgi:hypothetical protein